MDKRVLERFLTDSARYLGLDLAKGKTLALLHPRPAGVKAGWMLHRTVTHGGGFGNSLRA